jgi:serine/threonine protein kinase/tetratricopeptide (TPR) repeat protein
MAEHEDLRRMFDLALSAPADQRPALLERECRGNAPLKARIEAMLAAAEDDVFLASPTGDGLPEAKTADPLQVPAAATAPAPIREGPGTRIGPYKLLQLIGEGGFGSVFMAEQEKPVSRKVALKIIKLGMDTRQVIARFEAERQALAMMDHPNIARVLDAGATETGRPYFVMELCKGDPIVEYCDRNHISIPERLELFAQVCQAVQHAHTKGIIHRDIKPSNVLVSTQDGRPHAKVIDFGIAKATATRLTEKTLFTEHRQLIGTPEYMSPEQAEGTLDIDTRTDVYSLGVLLYELLTGTTPFTRKELSSAAYAEIQRIIREVEPPKPSTRLSKNSESLASVAAHRHTEPRKLGTIVRGDLDWIVMKALEKDRTRRYETANGLAMDVRRHLSGDPVLAAPPSTAYRVRKFVRRHRAQVIGGSVVAGALVLGMIGTGLELRRAVRAESDLRGQLVETVKAQKAEQARAEELKQVSDFQANMLAQVDTNRAGILLTKDVTTKLDEALRKEGIAEAERRAQGDAFAGVWRKVNATDTARDLIDVTILKPAIDAIDKQFKDDSLVDARLRQVLADRYVDLGLYESAVPLQAGVLALRRRVLGDEHPDTLSSLRSSADLLFYRGRYTEAEPLYRELLEKRRRVLGDDHRDTLTSVNDLGTCALQLRKLPLAEAQFREALERRRRVLGEDDPDTLTSINDVGEVLQAEGRLAEAEPFLLEAVEKSRRVRGEDHQYTLTAIRNVGFLLLAEKKYDESEPYFRESLDKHRRVMGEEHPDTLNAVNDMGQLLIGQHKLAEAETYLREALEKRRRVLGDDHPRTLGSINDLGVVLRLQGKLSEVEPYYREAMEGDRRTLGLEHDNTLMSINNLGALLHELGRNAEAVQLMAPAEAAARKVDTGGNASRLAGFLLDLGKARAGMDFDAGRFALAEANMLEARNLFVETKGESSKGATRASEALADLYGAWDKAVPGKGYGDKAADWKTKLVGQASAEKK